MATPTAVAATVVALATPTAAAATVAALATPTAAARSSKRVLLRLYSPLAVLVRTTHRVGLSDGEDGLPCASSQAYGFLAIEPSLLTTADAPNHSQTRAPDCPVVLIPGWLLQNVACVAGISKSF